jgi:DNA-binding transcriptional LysR family regulator
VLEERSATRAAARLHVTQSAVSNGLAKLRELLGDPLVVRKGRGLVPTPRAEELTPLLREVTARLAMALDRRGFVPEECTRTFTIGLADSHQACEVPRSRRHKPSSRECMRACSSRSAARSSSGATIHGCGGR